MRHQQSRATIEQREREKEKRKKEVVKYFVVHSAIKLSPDWIHNSNTLRTIY